MLSLQLHLGKFSPPIRQLGQAQGWLHCMKAASILSVRVFERGVNFRQETRREEKNNLSKVILLICEGQGCRGFDRVRGVFILSAGMVERVVRFKLWR